MRRSVRLLLARFPPARFFLLTLLLLCVTPPAARAVPMKRAKREIKHQIAALEEQWRTATLTGDAALLDRLLSDDYVGISWNGQVNTKASQLDRIRTHSLMLSKITLADVKVKVLHAVAVVTCRAEITGTNAGAPMDGTYRYTRVYQRLPGGQWKITNFEATRVPHANAAAGVRGVALRNDSHP